MSRLTRAARRCYAVDVYRGIAVLLVVAGCDGVFGLRHVSGGPADSGTADAAGFAGAVVADGPLIYLRLDETDGNVAHDLVDGGANGTILGNVALGKMGALADGNAAMSFDGIDCGIDLGSVAQFPGNAPYSVEAWIQPGLASHTYYEIAARWKAPPGPEGWNLFYSSDSIQFSREALGSLPGVVKTREPDFDTYHHVVATYDGSALAIYLDGHLEATTDAELALTSGTIPPLMVGAANGSTTTSPMYGLIDEVAIYDHALDASRVAAHFAARAVP